MNKNRVEVLVGIGLAFLAYVAYLGVNLIPLLLFGAFLYMMAQRFGVGSATGTRGVIVNASRQRAPISFADIGGQATAKQELVEALDFIKHDADTKRLGIRPLKGILLSGPPGTGKTLLAKAAASYTDSVFLAESGSSFIEMYAGVGAARVRGLFARARENARKQNKRAAIIFIDEIDVLGGKRGKNQGHQEYDQTLNQLLVEMDGINVDDDVRVLLIAATNRADLLDSALLRPGRFDRLVRVDLPDREARLQILQLHTRNKPLADDVDLAQVAEETYGFSGAHLESLCNEAAILAMRQQMTEVCQQHFVDSVDKVIMGEKLDRRPGAEELRRVAVHEAGHALIAELMRPGAVASVSILSRGDALGYVRQTPGEDSYLQTEDQLRAQLAVLLAGAAAEKLILDSGSTGAVGDFREAVKLARRYVLSGMSPLGVVDEELISKEAMHDAQQALLQEIEDTVRQLLTERQSILLSVVERLLADERVEGDKLRELLGELAA
ncbi:MAG: AAA family ATPase [Bacillota bacterium]|jgi:cell division protease FtsH